MTNDSKLNKNFSNAIKAKDNEVFVSQASIWEIAIKVSINKLILTKPILEFKNYFVNESINELSIEHSDFDLLARLPFYHNDPFDRLIISQAVNNNFTVITDDKKFQQYPVQLLS
jgi:PIN domain nuclease of toxin-antitoxin system